MKTRVEQGSEHVTIICSKVMAEAIGSAIVSTSDDLIEVGTTSEHLFKLGSALERGENFEEEEPTS